MTATTPERPTRSRQPRCRKCQHRIWPWQPVASFGPFGHSRRDAAWIAHMRCAGRATPNA